MEWQTGDFSRHASFRFTLPHQFLLLCKLVNVTPFQILSDFMNNLACGSLGREGRGQAKETLIAYFIEHGYGQDIFTPAELTAIFKEMDAIGLLYPRDAAPLELEQHVEWRAMYHDYWFRKWYYRFNRS